MIKLSSLLKTTEGNKVVKLKLKILRDITNQLSVLNLQLFVQDCVITDKLQSFYSPAALVGHTIAERKLWSVFMLLIHDRPGLLLFPSPHLTERLTILGAKLTH